MACYRASDAFARKEEELHAHLPKINPDAFQLLGENLNSRKLLQGTHS